ncbi:MAG: hypothetical protein DCO96_02525 [Fluviicola sp. XM-24bin1]|nr:MAG: hypothetical protein DCO96_02525 [Fluviicola sp. XM-24bin1]
MLRWTLIVLLIVGGSFSADAQHRRMKKKESDSKGTLWGYWGYNRTRYTNSSIRFVGPGYDFTLADAKGHDEQPIISANNYLRLSNLTVPQFNLRLGYNFRDHWAISLGYDHFKYIFADDNEVFLSGTIDPGVDDVTNWSGTYNAEPIVTNRKLFHYENSDGMNFIRLQLHRVDTWFSAGNRDQFKFSTDLGFSLGGILSRNDFKFAGQETKRTTSMSGFGTALHVAPRFEFFNHLFIQPTLSAGFIRQGNVRTRPNNASSYAQQSLGYGEFNTVVGFFAYIRPTNGCNSCPTW